VISCGCGFQVLHAHRDLFIVIVCPLYFPVFALVQNSHVASATFYLIILAGTVYGLLVGVSAAVFQFGVCSLHCFVLTTATTRVLSVSVVGTTFWSAKHSSMGNVCSPLGQFSVLSAVGTTFWSGRRIAAWEAYATPWANPTHVLELHGHPLTVRNDSTDILWQEFGRNLRNCGIAWRRPLCTHYLGTMISAAYFILCAAE
jgi:hypothetical protein